MKSIKFSHVYSKLLDSHNDVIESAKLLQVISVNLEDLSQYFLDYDTDNGKYQLPKKGKYMMLIFQKPYENYVTDYNLFTTLRRWTPQKEQYYKSAIGEFFKVELVKEAACKR